MAAAAATRGCDAELGADFAREMERADEQLSKQRKEQLQEMLRAVKDPEPRRGASAFAANALRVLPANSYMSESGKFWEGRQGMKRDAMQACGLHDLQAQDGASKQGGAAVGTPGRHDARGGAAPPAAAASARTGTPKAPCPAASAAPPHAGGPAHVKPAGQPGRSATQKPPAAPVQPQLQRHGYGAQRAGDKPETPKAGVSATHRPPSARDAPGGGGRAPSATAGPPSAQAGGGAKRDRPVTPTGTDRRKERPRRANPNIKTADWDRSDLRHKMLVNQLQYDLTRQYTMPPRLPVDEVFTAKLKEYKKRYGTAPELPR